MTQGKFKHYFGFTSLVFVSIHLLRKLPVNLVSDEIKSHEDAGNILYIHLKGERN